MEGALGRRGGGPVMGGRGVLVPWEGLRVKWIPGPQELTLEGDSSSPSRCLEAEGSISPCPPNSEEFSHCG